MECTESFSSVSIECERCSYSSLHRSAMVFSNGICVNMKAFDCLNPWEWKILKYIKYYNILFNKKSRTLSEI